MVAQISSACHMGPRSVAAAQKEGSSFCARGTRGAVVVVRWALVVTPYFDLPANWEMLPAIELVANPLNLIKLIGSNISISRW